MNKKLFLIDAYALIYRSYFAFIKNPRVTSTGINTSAIFGFANTLLELIKTEQPSYLAIGFDQSKLTFRHQLFADYKANREATPEDIKIAIPYVRQLAEAMKIPIIEKDGYEADDVIGTVAKIASKQGYDVYMMTPDKDYGQLVEENIKIYKPKTFGQGFETLGVNEICNRYQIDRPTQLIDILALWGDKADNIEGVEGIGEKTAAKLIAKYDTIEGIYQNIDDIKGKIKENLLNSRDKLQLAKTLVTIVTDIEMPINIDLMQMTAFDTEAVDKLFDVLEFRTLRQRFNQINLSHNDKASRVIAKPEIIQYTLWGEEIQNIEKQSGDIVKHKTLNDFDHNYKLIEQKNDLKQLIETIKTSPILSFDTETNQLDAIDARLVGLSICNNPGQAYYISVNKHLSDSYIIETIKPLLEDKTKTIIGQNIKYDLLVLKKYGVETQATLVDTMIAHYLLHPEQRHNIDYLAVNYLNWEKITTESLIGKRGAHQVSMANLNPKDIVNYACEDADVAFRLWAILKLKLEKSGLLNIFYNIEMPLVKVLVEMEYSGVTIDSNALNDLKIEYQKISNSIETEIYHIAGYKFNISSPRQLGELLFTRLKITDKPKLTKTKQFATGEEILVELKERHPIVKLILEYRELQKLLNTYIEALPKLVNKNTGRIHTSFNQAVTTTGRLSSTNPNLQNIPIRDSRGKAIRQAFIPSSPDNVLIAADYSQIELRIMAHLSSDQNMKSAFDQDIDIHQDTASKLFGIDTNKVTADQRRQAKGANFGIIYGISAFGLANNTGITQREAKELIDNYFKTYPKVKQYMDNTILFAREHGFVQTIMGRKRFFNDINSANAVVRGAAERNAINAPIQGSSADMIKIAMIDIQNEITEQKLKAKMILQVHDELVFDVPNNEIDNVKRIVEEKMVNAIPLSVKLKVDINIANNWLAAH